MATSKKGFYGAITMDKFSAEDYLVMIGDVAETGYRLQNPASSLLDTSHLPDAAAKLFKEIGRLADAAAIAISDNDA